MRIPKLERVGDQALSEICQIRIEGDLEAATDVPIEPLELTFSTHSDSALRQLKDLLACESAELHRPRPLSHGRQFNPVA